jgi:hypothetical protein
VQLLIATPGSAWRAGSWSATKGMTHYVLLVGCGMTLTCAAVLQALT